MRLFNARRRRYRRRFFRIPQADTLAALICLVSVCSIIFFGVTIRFPDGFAADLVGDIDASLHSGIAIVMVR